MVKILVVEDDEKMRIGLVEILTEEGYTVDSAENGRAGLDKIKKTDYELVLTDLIMPVMGGMEVLHMVKHQKPRTLVILITAFATIENAVEAMKAGASEYITKPFKIDEIQTKIRLVLEEARFKKHEFEGFDEASFKALSNPIRKNVVVILHKKGKLTEEEYEQMKEHVNIGKKVLNSIVSQFKIDKLFFSIGENICAYHHEKFNGKGYPFGLRGDDIPVEARIFALCDAYDALRSKRPYKEVVPHDETVEIIKKDSGTHFDPDVIEAFLRCEKEFKEISNMGL